MKVKKIDVYWCNEFSNVPNLELYVDKKPDYNQIMRFECKKYHDNDIYYAYDEDSGLVKFYYHDHKNHNGYYGAKFKLKMKDGTVETLIGPWSSRPAIMHMAGFSFCSGISLIEEEDLNSKFAAYMLNSKLEHLIKEFLPDLEYYIAANGEIYIPKNQPLNLKFKGSYSEKRKNLDKDPPKYNPNIGINENYLAYS